MPLCAKIYEYFFVFSMTENVTKKPDNKHRKVKHFQISEHAQNKMYTHVLFCNTCFYNGFRRSVYLFFKKKNNKPFFYFFYSSDY